MRDLLIGQFIPQESIIHQLDPRTKILAAAAAISVVFAVENAVGYALAGLYCGLVTAMARLPIGLVFRGVRPVVPLLVVTALLHIFIGSRDGQVIQGLASGLAMVARIALLVTISSLVTLTTSPIQVTDGMERLLKPFSRLGLPVHELAMMMTIALRFIPTLLDEADRIIKAQVARGADFASGGPVRRIQRLIPVIVPLFVAALQRAEDLAAAMEARCYRGATGRTQYRQLRLGPADAGAAIVTGIALAALVWVGR